MSEERDMTPVEFPYKFSTENIHPYTHYNTDKINPLTYNQFLIHNYVGCAWQEDYLIKENSTVEPEEYISTHHQDIIKHNTNYTIPGEDTSINPYELYQAGPSIEELINRTANEQSEE